eukprot:CAMPEP_0113893680 /NCGR_PEP_ID=MMETSP0780_2-20120614/16242_1 /TAXON_ID=652834 /ORGANISM="Palpitomonas bilix" /LENGTH=393 /DNA_ID=CAMNT_0000884027 /DNA_START=155 /DNA_END=1336 /DNA_ORIENTATION=+ /assembly_acc=CAM_ASM_000599
MLTLGGLGWVLASFCIIFFYSPNLAGEAPDWVYWAAGTFFLIYVILDNIDGKQARRTKTSSPLGEVLDHGVDAMVSLFGPVMFCDAMGAPHMILPGLLFIQANFYLSSWEHAMTGVMSWGNEFLSVDEALLMDVVILYGRAYAGRDGVRQLIDLASFSPISSLLSLCPDGWARVEEVFTMMGVPFVFKQGGIPVGDALIFVGICATVFTSTGTIIGGFRGKKSVWEGVKLSTPLVLYLFSLWHVPSLLVDITYGEEAGVGGERIAIMSNVFTSPFIAFAFALLFGFTLNRFIMSRIIGMKYPSLGDLLSSSFPLLLSLFLRYLFHMGVVHTSLVVFTINTALILTSVLLYFVFAHFIFGGFEDATGKKALVFLPVPPPSPTSSSLNEGKAKAE